MDREEEALKISKSIQRNINKLKKLNFSVDHSHQNISVFDNAIAPEKGLASEGDDYQNTILYSFDTAIRK